MAWYFESRRHSLASRGISTAQRLKILTRLNQMKAPNRNIAVVRRIRLKILEEMYDVQASGFFTAPENFKPFLDQFSEKDSHYVAGDVFYAVAQKVIPNDLRLHTYLREVKGDIDKDKLHKIIYSKDKAVQKEVRAMDMEILGFLSRNQDFEYQILKDKEGNERLITYTTEFKKQRPKFFKELVVKVKNE